MERRILTIDEFVNEEKMKDSKNVTEACTTDWVQPGVPCDIMGMKGVVNEITRHWNNTTFEFTFKNELGEEHTAVYIGDKYILKESEE